MEAEWKANGGLMGMMGMTGEFYVFDGYGEFHWFDGGDDLDKTGDLTLTVILTSLLNKPIKTSTPLILI